MYKNLFGDKSQKEVNTHIYKGVTNHKVEVNAPSIQEVDSPTELHSTQTEFNSTFIS